MEEWLGLDWAVEVLGQLNAIAGWLLWKADELQEAKRYLTHAHGLNKLCLSVPIGTPLIRTR